MIPNLGMAFLFGVLINTRVGIIAVPIFLTYVFCILLQILEDFVSTNILLFSGVFAEISAAWFMLYLANRMYSSETLNYGVFRQGMLFCVAAVTHAFAFLDFNIKTDFVYSNYNTIIDIIIILQILNIGATMYGQRSRSTTILDRRVFSVFIYDEVSILYDKTFYKMAKKSKNQSRYYKDEAG